MSGLGHLKNHHQRY